MFDVFVMAEIKHAQANYVDGSVERIHGAELSRGNSSLQNSDNWLVYRSDGDLSVKPSLVLYTFIEEDRG